MIHAAGLGVLVAGLTLTLVSMLAHLATRPQFSWPEPRVQGIYTIWVTSHGPLHMPVLRPNWPLIADFFITWATVLVLLALFFCAGLYLHTLIFQALAQPVYAPLWRNTCAA